MNKTDGGTETTSHAFPILGDRPWAPGDADRLKFRPLARQLANVIGDPSLRTGFVIGLDGPWGSGKSSLCSQVIEELGHGTSATKVVHFNPWLIGERAALMSELFGGIAGAVEAMARTGKPGAANISLDTAKATADLVRRYAKHLGVAGKFLSAARLFLPVAGETIAASVQAVLEGIGAAGEIAEPQKSLAEQKAQLEEALAALPRRILVVVDDAERLEPIETLEMLRLVKAAGGLPNVVYLVAFDRTALVRNIDRALGVTGVGSEYLEKIIQATVSVPEPEDRVLRAWFTEEVRQLTGLHFDERRTEEGRRLAAVIDREGGRRLKTPRDVVRCVNSLRLVWPAVKAHVDVGDLVWLHLVRLKALDLYKWIEGYLVQVAEVSTTTAMVEDSSPAVKELLRLLSADGRDPEREMYRLREFIPGIGRSSGPLTDEDEKWDLYHLGEGSFDARTAQRRLGSPHYFRYYFSLGQHGGLLPSETLDEYRRLLTAAPDQFSVETAKLATALMPNGQLQLAPLLDYLTSILDQLGHPERNTIVQSLAVSMDAAILREPVGFGRGRCWSVGEALLFKTLRRMQPQERDEAFIAMVRDGTALAWLARAIRVARNDSDRDIEISDEAWQEASRLFEAKLSTGVRSVIESASPDLVLSTWQLITHEPELFKKRLAAMTRLDKNFIRILHSCRGWVSSDRLYRPLNARHVRNLFDFDAARERAERIQRQDLETDIRVMLEEVLESFREGDQLRQ